MWSVTASRGQHPDTFAALAIACRERSVVILGLRTRHATETSLRAELILHTPGGWSQDDVAAMCRSAGLTEVNVSPCRANVSEDQTLRYLHAGGVVADRPDALTNELADLLDASVRGRESGPHSLVLGDAGGSRVCLSRAVPFTESEIARARELSRLAEQHRRSHGPGRG